MPFSASRRWGLVFSSDRASFAGQPAEYRGRGRDGAAAAGHRLHRKLVLRHVHGVEAGEVGRIHHDVLGGARGHRQVGDFGGGEEGPVLVGTQAVAAGVIAAPCSAVAQTPVFAYLGAAGAIGVGVGAVIEVERVHNALARAVGLDAVAGGARGNRNAQVAVGRA